MTPEQEMMARILTPVLIKAQNEAMERAAKIADWYERHGGTAGQIAADIRRLKEELK